MVWTVHDNNVIHCDLSSVSFIHAVHQRSSEHCHRTTYWLPPIDRLALQISVYRILSGIGTRNILEVFVGLLQSILSRRKGLYRATPSPATYIPLAVLSLRYRSLIDLLTLIDATCRFYMGKCPIGGSRFLDMSCLQKLIKWNPSELIPPFRSSMITSMSWGRVGQTKESLVHQWTRY